MSDPNWEDEFELICLRDGMRPEFIYILIAFIRHTIRREVLKGKIEELLNLPDDLLLLSDHLKNRAPELQTALDEGEKDGEG